MLKSTIYIVSADHPSDKYRADHKEITVVAAETPEVNYSASASPYGYGREQSSPEWAICDLLQSNGCEGVVIHGTKEALRLKELNKTKLFHAEPITSDNWRPGQIKEGFKLYYDPHETHGWLRQRCFETFSGLEDFITELTASDTEEEGTSITPGL